MAEHLAIMPALSLLDILRLEPNCALLIRAPKLLASTTSPPQASHFAPKPTHNLFRARCSPALSRLQISGNTLGMGHCVCVERVAPRRLICHPWTVSKAREQQDGRKWADKLTLRPKCQGFCCCYSNLTATISAARLPRVCHCPSRGALGQPVCGQNPIIHQTHPLSLGARQSEGAHANPSPVSRHTRRPS